MELTKQDNQMAKGIAILGMIMLHLFCRTGNLPYTPMLWIGDTPLIYYLGLFGDLCTPIYCFCSGYAQMALHEKNGKMYRRDRYFRLLKFLLNYWTVLLLFTLIGFLCDPDGTIPGSFSRFVGNFLLYNISYNGAWWFVLTYTLLILISPWLIDSVQKISSPCLGIISGSVYFVSYVFRFVWSVNIPNVVFSELWEQAMLLGTSQFSFLLGMIFYKEKIISKLRTLPWKKRFRNGVCIAVPLLMMVVHGIVQSLIIAPITGIFTMICFHLIDKPKWQSWFFMFLGKHSTNIWLVHMFFYLTLFEDCVFSAKLPVLIIFYMLSICVVVSHVINIILNRMACLCEAIRRKERFRHGL